jgi:hypothetical protein
MRLPRWPTTRCSARIEGLAGFSLICSPRRVLLESEIRSFTLTPALPG